MDRSSNFPSLESIETLLASSDELRSRVMAIAEKLKALHEYHDDQALLIAADIVLSNQRLPAKGATAKGRDAAAGL